MRVRVWSGFVFFLGEVFQEPVGCRQWKILCPSEVSFRSRLCLTIFSFYLLK